MSGIDLSHMVCGHTGICTHTHILSTYTCSRHINSNPNLANIPLCLCVHKEELNPHNNTVSHTHVRTQFETRVSKHLNSYFGWGILEVTSRAMPFPKSCWTFLPLFFYAVLQKSFDLPWGCSLENWGWHARNEIRMSPTLEGGRMSVFSQGTWLMF